jgi:hypothetical protein
VSTVAQLGFLHQWANFSCAEKIQWAEWAAFFADRQKIFGPTKY